MSNPFKVGDKVKYLGKEDKYLKTNNIYTVACVDAAFIGIDLTK